MENADFYPINTDTVLVLTNQLITITKADGNDDTNLKDDTNGNDQGNILETKIIRY